MPKPTTLPEWASDETNNTEPSSGQKDTGWENNQAAVSSFFNWYQFLVYQWIEYLDAAGDLTTTFDVATLNVGGDLDVAGVATFQDTVEIDGAVTHNAVTTLVGALKHGDRVLNIPGSMGRANADTTFEFSGYSGSIESTASTTITWPIPLQVGDRIKSVTFRVFGRAPNTADITAADVILITAAMGSTSLGTTTLSNVTGSIQSLTINVTDTALAANEHLFAGLVINAAGVVVFGVDVTYDRV